MVTLDGCVPWAPCLWFFWAALLPYWNGERA